MCFRRAAAWFDPVVTAFRLGVEKFGECFVKYLVEKVECLIRWVG